MGRWHSCMVKRAAAKLQDSLDIGFNAGLFIFKSALVFKIDSSDEVLINGRSFQISTSVLQEKRNAVLMLCATMLRDPTTGRAKKDTVEMEISTIWVTFLPRYFLS